MANAATDVTADVIGVTVGTSVCVSSVIAGAAPSSTAAVAGNTSLVPELLAGVALVLLFFGFLSVNLIGDAKR